MIAVCRLRYCERTRAYAERRTKDGKNKREIIRCLKRYITRETYHALLADLTALQAPQPSTAPPSSRRPAPHTVTTIHCGGFGASSSRRRA